MSDPVFTVNASHSIYQAIEAASNYSELGATHRVDPVAGVVAYSPLDLSGYAETGERSVEWIGGAMALPDGLAYSRFFEPAEFLTDGNWQWHLKEFIEAGDPFYVQTVEVDELGAEDEEGNTESTPVGWALLVRIKTDAEREANTPKAVTPPAPLPSTKTAKGAAE